MKTRSMCRRGHNNTRSANPPKTREPLDPPRSYLCVQVAGKRKTGGQRSSRPSLNPSVREEKAASLQLTELRVRLVHRCAPQLPHATFFDNNRAECCVKPRHSHAPLPLRVFKITRVAARLDLTSVLVATPSQNQQNSTKHGVQPFKVAVVAFKLQHT